MTAEALRKDRQKADIVDHPTRQQRRLSPKLRVKIYSDGADRESMLALARDPMVQGLTTNPTLMRKAGITDYVSFAQEILSEIKDKPISFEVFADSFPEMERQAYEIAKWGENVFVKIPITNSLGEPSYPLLKKLTRQKVKVNVTAILTLEQVVRVCDVLAPDTPAIVSVFAGRIADTGVDPVPIMQAAAEVCRSMAPSAELLWASTREAYNLIQADHAGCDIVTVTPDIMKKIALFGRDLSELSLDTVKMFKDDAEAAGFVV